MIMMGEVKMVFHQGWYVTGNDRQVYTVIMLCGRMIHHLSLASDELALVDQLNEILLSQIF